MAFTGSHSVSAAPRIVGFAGRPMAFIGHYVRRHALGHGFVLLAVLLGVGCAIGSQYAVKNLVDTLSKGPEGAAIWPAFALLAGLVATDNLSWRAGGWVASRVFVAVTGDVRRDLFAHLTGHAPSYFADRSPGTLASRITATSNAIFQVLSMCAWNVLPPCFAVTGAMVLLTLINPLMAGVLIVLSAGLAVFLVRLAGRGRPLHHQFATQAAAVDGELVDVIGNMPLVRAFGATLIERGRFADRVEVEMTARRRSLRYLEKLRVIHAVMTAALTAGLLAWSLLLWQAGQITTGDVVLVTTMGFTILHGTRDLAVALVDMVQHVARLAEALETLLVGHELVDAHGAENHRHARGAVVFDDVTFTYPGALPGKTPVLRGLNLAIEPGERVGLVGRSGSGKSTVLNLLQRARVPNGGHVLIDGRDIGAITDDSLRAAISIVPQDVMLFARTVRENIRYGKMDATDDEVAQAAEAAGCDFIDALEDGYDTMVGDRGVKLSGGQRQRIAIARAFLRDAPILLLDEATSALDTESELAIQRALDRLMTGRTVIAVAHRLSTLREFDRIVVMQDGEVAQDAPPAVLERQDGLYRTMLSRQAFQMTADPV